MRILTLLALPFEALIGYGDFLHFYNLAEFAAGEGGLPWLGHWVEFPPLFPYLSLGFYGMAGGSQHVYVYLLALLVIVFDLGSLWLLGRIGKQFWDPRSAERLGWIYVGFLSIPAFGWWTFDSIAVFFMLLVVWGYYASEPNRAGIAAGVGGLVKYLPLLPLVLFWRFRPRRQAAIVTGLAVGILLLTMIPFFIAQSENASASLRSQSSKGSWETVWALLDGNYGTGVFGPLEERLRPESALLSRANPAVIPTWVPALVAAALGIAATARTRAQSGRPPVGLLGVLYCLLFLASPGWSPQWISYLIPFILLGLVLRKALLFALTLALAGLLEWPILLSRGRFDLLAIPVLVRTTIMALLAIEFWRVAAAQKVPD